MKTTLKCQKKIDGEWLNIDYDDVDWSTINDIIVRGEHHFVREQWTLCTERPPIEQGEVIVSCHDDSGDTPFDYTSCGWVTPDGKYWIVDDEINYHVIAWKPLPKPYKVVDENT